MNDFFIIDESFENNYRVHEKGNAKYCRFYRLTNGKFLCSQSIRRKKHEQFLKFINIPDEKIDSIWISVLAKELEAAILIYNRKQKLSKLLS